MYDVLHECREEDGNKFYKDMNEEEFKNMCARIFHESDLNKDGKLLNAERKLFLQKLMQASGVTPETMAKVLNGQYELYGPAAEIMDEEVWEGWNALDPVLGKNMYAMTKDCAKKVDNKLYRGMSALDFKNTLERIFVATNKDGNLSPEERTHFLR
jgi:hypothetical protein